MKISPSHAVHIYATVRVKVLVDAKSQVEAIDKALDRINLDEIEFTGIPNGAELFEYADEVTAVLVDTLNHEGEFIEELTQEYRDVGNGWVAYTYKPIKNQKNKRKKNG